MFADTDSILCCPTEESLNISRRRYFANETRRQLNEYTKIKKARVKHEIDGYSL